MDLTAREEYQFSSVLDLHKTEDATVLVNSHRSVVEFHQPNMETRELCHDYLAGDPWTEEEREVARQKKKPLTEFNPLKTSERTFVGAMIQQRFDIKPAPREPTDQSKADIYSALYHWTADLGETRYKDPGLTRAAWAGGNAWQESFVMVNPGKKPRIIIENQNNFAIYPDPNRRDLVNNSDCEFIDRVSWMSRSQLADAIPEKEDDILASLPDPSDTQYAATKVYADRTHEWENYRNGKFKVIERFYRVNKKNWIGIDPRGERTQLGDVRHDVRQDYKENYPHHTLHVEREEFLYLAIVCPSMGNVFLYNNEYHCQPRDVVTGKVMFPLVELVDEDLDGQVSGHVFPQLSGIKLINSLLTNQLFAAKNAAGQSHVGSSDHFDEQTRTDVEENHNDGSRVFWKKPGAPDGTGMSLIEQGKSAPDNSYLLDYAQNYTQEVSSTPPSMKGQSEGNVAGVLNEQRIQQSFIQSQGFMNNYAGFLTRRAKLWKQYWKQYWDYEEVIRILEKKDDKDPDWMTINEIVMDEFGNVSKKNGLDDADAYDISFEDSWKSPTTRDKVRKEIAELMQNPATQQDGELSAEMLAYYFLLSDAPQEFKSRIKAIAESKKQAAEAQAKQGPPPEPMRLSMSIKAEDLHDPLTVTMLESSRAIPPEVAEQMRQAPAPTGNPELETAHKDATAENESLKQEATNRTREHEIKAVEIRLNAQKVAEELKLKDRELSIKEAELDLKHIEATKPPAPEAPDTSIHVAHINAASALEREHVKAAASIHQAERSLENSEGNKKAHESAKAAKTMTDKSAKDNQATAASVAAIAKAQAELAAKVSEQGGDIAKIERAVKAPKRVTIERDQDGKIIGASAAIEGVE